MEYIVMVMSVIVIFVLFIILGNSKEEFFTEPTEALQD